MNYDLLLNDNTDELTDHVNIAKKIDRFQVIVMYDRQPNFFDYNYLMNFPSKKVRNKIDTNRIFPRVKNETFIVRQKNYEENIQLFFKLRLNARYELLAKVTEFMTAKFFRTYESHLTPLLENKPTLKWEIINKLYRKYETMLSSHARLNEEKAWSVFSTWYRTYLLNHTVNQLLSEHGYGKLNAMDREELNLLFLEKLNASFASDDSFLNAFTADVNLYIEKMVSEILALFELEKDSMEQINELFGDGARLADHQSVETEAKSNHLTVMSNALYQFVTEAISNQKFQCASDEWPQASIQNATLSGSVYLMPPDKEKNAGSLAKAQEYAASLTEFDVDVLDSLCHMYLAQSQTDGRTEIRLDDLLKIRGLKTKLGGTGRRGGYEREQRIRLLKALSVIQYVWIEMDSVRIYEQGKPVSKRMEGRVFEFFHEDGSPYLFTAETIPDTIYMAIGDVFDHFLQGSARQVKLLPNQAIEFNPHQQKWEKKLIRYISWRWRTQARNAGYLQPHKVSTLLEKIGVQADSQTPSRIRDRFEKALDSLEDEGIITFWQYNQWNEESMTKKGWLRIWLETTIIIAPPDEIISYYQPIERKKAGTARLTPAAGKDETDREIGAKFKKKRRQLGYTLEDVSVQLNISTSYISNIERGASKPSKNIYQRMQNWLECNE
ncbi:helix-turn-helix domain-containing protein [Sporosarcina sp. P33]|uniref:helix-turn-helix domain-containing protein n=1 Tax=Sporosarcina sp. P33 TaxID=1930764 RepID=UPI0009BCBCF1|nr:helix-turn-helix transcriptional regulator [Sporosarcina sp. P33]ARD46919.1 hypothetical protein SporoP33_00805 [Sporosarcina sp. P33]